MKKKTADRQPLVTEARRIDEVLTRGVNEVISKDHLKAKLLSGKRLRVKLGIDPTGANLHIGHAIPLLKLKAFQDLGHTAVLIIGDATGTVGDTSDKESERPMLSVTEVKKNEKTYLKQIGKILDMSKTEVHHNSKWLKPLTFGELTDEANQFSVSDFIARDNIKRRLAAGSRVSLREMLYPVMQGLDSVAVKADVELGGVDQRFNLLAGRTLQAHHRQEPQDIVMTRLLTAGGGKKMSKSLGNTINILDSADDMYAKAMRIDDGSIIDCLELATEIPVESVQQYSVRLNTGENPKKIKEAFAKAIVSMFHSPKEAETAHERFEKLFAKKEVADDAMQSIDAEEGSELGELMEEHKLVPSKSEFRRLVEGGGVRDLQTGEKLTNPKTRITIPLTLKIGKHTFIRITLRRKKR